LAGFYDEFQSKFDDGAKKKLGEFIRMELGPKATVAHEVGLAGPKLANTHLAVPAGATFEKRAGEVAVNGISFDDATQGNLGDCYFISAMASLAKVHPELIENSIKTNRDGTYTVRFYQQKEATKPAQSESITVTGDMPTRNGVLEYVAARDVRELWPQILEKAYAQWKGGYEKIEGGMSANAFIALTGAKPSAFFVTSDANPKTVFAQLKTALENKGAVVALSKPFETDIRGMVSDHAYSVLGIVERDGKQLVQVRNPWGQTEIEGDGKNDGIFEISAEQFVKAFSTVESVRIP
jgi:hypothetical protein